MNRYSELRHRQQEEFNKLPLGFAFSDKQFEQMMTGWGLDASKDSDLEKIAHLYAGGYIQKKDIPAYKEVTSRHDKELSEAIEADKTGEGFIYDMFYYELGNHEYGYTGDVEETLDALGYTLDDINADERFVKALKKAMHDIMSEEG